MKELNEIHFETYMKNGDAKRQSEKIKVGIRENAFNFINVIVSKS